MMMKEKIIAELKKVLKKLALASAEVHLEHPENLEHGDYSSNIAMAMFSNVKCQMSNVKCPLELAKLIVKNIPKTDYLEKIEVAPPGFINFWFSKAWLGRQLGRVPKFPKQDKKIMVEFAHPNTHKPFHIGHLRTTILGESISRILKVVGDRIIRANYQGDVGLHIAKALWAFAKLKTKNEKLKTLDQKIDFLGKAYTAGNKAYEEDEKAKKEIIELNHKIYAKDREIVGLWQETRAWSLDYFSRIYKRLDTQFDRFYFESECLEGVKIAEKALEKGILAKSKGAIVFPGEKYGLDTRVFITSDGLPTYEAKELKLAEMEFSEFGEIDKCIHVVGPEQTSFFKVTFRVEELLNPKKYKDKQYHRVYGWVRLKKGKMASRLGKVILAEWLLDEIKGRLLKEFKMEPVTAESVAVGAVKYSMLKLDPISELVFDINESISLEGNSGPYLQYTYARAKSVLRKATIVVPPEEGLSQPQTPARWPNGLLGGEIAEEELSLLRTIYKFPEVVLEAGESYAPNLICNFLFDLAQKFNLFYNQHRIIGSANENFRLALTANVTQILKNGLNLLGIKTLERM